LYSLRDSELERELGPVGKGDDERQRLINAYSATKPDLALVRKPLCSLIRRLRGHGTMDLKVQADPVDDLAVRIQSGAGFYEDVLVTSERTIRSHQHPFDLALREQILALDSPAMLLPTPFVELKLMQRESSGGPAIDFLLVLTSADPGVDGAMWRGAILKEGALLGLVRIRPVD
jgi:hypothetical protein